MKESYEAWAEGSFGKVKLDSIGEWSYDKLTILKAYCEQYVTILNKQKSLKYCYVDAFSGSGKHIMRETGEYVAGSPLNALNVSYPFKHYYLVDSSRTKTGYLKELLGDRNNVTIIQEDCNTVLPDIVFPKLKYEDYMRGLCFLDPYGLDINWNVIELAGRMRSIEVFINFPDMDINRNLARSDPKNVRKSDINRMDRFWGDNSWYDVLYEPEYDLFGSETDRKVNKVSSKLAGVFQTRLNKLAGFDFVPKPVAMRNKNGAIVYHLFFATQNSAGNNIVNWLFRQYDKRIK